MSIFNLKQHPDSNVDFVSAYSKLVKEMLIQSVDEMLIFDEVDSLSNDKVFLFSKNENNQIDGILTGITVGNAGYIGYILTDKAANEDDLTNQLIDHAEMEFKKIVEAKGDVFVGMFTELLSSYEDEDYICPYTSNQVFENQSLMIKNKFYPINVEYVEPSIEHGVLDQYMFLAFRKAHIAIRLKVKDLYTFIETIYGTVYELNGTVLKDYMKYIKDSSELREDFYAEFYQIQGLPTYKLYELGENPY